MSRRLFLTIAVCAVLAAPAVAQQQPVKPADFGQWESLGAGRLSPDGRWLAYDVNRVNERRELRVHGMAGDTTLAFLFATGATFTPDSRWLGFSIGLSPEETEKLTAEKKPVHSRFTLLDLSSGDTVSVPAIASFRFSADGRFVAMRGYPAEGRNAADVVVRELATARLATFGNVNEFAWSEVAPLLALTIETVSGTGNGVQIYNGASGELRVLDSSDQRYRGLTWRDDADDLAVLRTRADSAYRDTTHHVLAWKRLRGESPVALHLDPGTVPELSSASRNGTGSRNGGEPLRIAEHRAPSWSADGETIYVGMRPREEASRPDSTVTADSADAAAAQDTTAKPVEEKRSEVQVWHARDVRILPMQKAQEQQDLRRTLLAAWHTGENRIVQLQANLRETARVLEGDRYVTETDRTPYTFGAKFGRDSEDVYLVDAQSGERRKVLEDIRYFQGGSASGEHLLWFDGQDYWSHDIASDRRTNLTANVDAIFEDTDHDYPVDILPPRGTAGWTEDDRNVLVYDEYDVWSIASDGSGGRRLTNGSAEQVVHRLLRLTGEFSDPIDSEQPVYLSMTGERTKKSGFARIRGGRAPERLLFDDARIARLTRADSTDTFAFTRERFDDSPDWFVAADGFRNPDQVSVTNPFQGDFAWGHAELIDFTSRAGVDLQAVLLYPAGYDASRRYPMIVYTYEMLSQALHNYVVPSERSYYNLNVFTANGYFVLMPDIVYRGREPGISALDAVEPAVQSIIAKGVIDPARIGLVGHSWGGYQATFLPTRTNIFAASVAGAPITNFLSFAGAIHWTPGNPEFDHWETGQARMGVPPWEDFDAYLRNSPIHKVNDLETPMLMMFGDADGTVDWHQGIEFYNFARRAGKDDFVMLVYPGEDHGLRKKENQIDYHRRILEWFGHWLKGEEAPAWITEGVTWLDRKKLLEGR
ncbi:MAG: alpha/beta fold hydrolase [Longimicrobiales bacterium]